MPSCLRILTICTSYFFLLLALWASYSIFEGSVRLQGPIGLDRNVSPVNHYIWKDKVPNFWGCQNDVAKALPYCDMSLSIDERLEDLLSHLTLDEKVDMIGADPTQDVCMTHTMNVSRIGLPDYYWLVETNTAVGSACIAENKCATEFSGPLSIAASFNRSSWFLKGSVFGTEQRALMNVHGERFHTHSGRHIGLTAFGPNINQQRDPRFGRSSELPGEDPFLSGQYAAHMVQGMQERDANGYPKVLAYLKHFTAYSREEGRGNDDYNISMYDLFDTYLPQYEMGMVQGGATGVMCSYNAVNGIPACANDYLLNKILRQRWNRSDAHVTTDCGAVNNLRGKPIQAADEAQAAAMALMNGADIEMGSTLFVHNLTTAITLGYATEEAVNQAIRRSYRPHFIAGRFDDPTLSEWFSLGLDDIQSKKHQEIQLEAALQGLVLLKHEDSILPIAAGTKLAVLGPLGMTRSGLMSDYESDQSCFGGGHDCIPTLAESIGFINGKEFTVAAAGVDVDSRNTSDVERILQLAADRDLIVLCLGNTKTQEQEGFDRKDTALPGQQYALFEAVLTLRKPVVLVLVNGGQIALDGMTGYPSAIIEAFNPNGIGGTALAASLFGQENRWGKLPYTIYPYSVMQSFDMKDHSMSAPPGRTYRYFTGKATYPFGYGLSLTAFETSCFHQRISDSSILLECTVWNTGNRTGDEVIQIYHAPGDDIRRKAKHPVPIRQLIGFERVRLQPGETKDLVFKLPFENALSLINENGERTVPEGTRRILVTNGVDDPVEIPIIISHTQTLESIARV
jgi:beta-glucosidase-like glycosyl hydrolase